MAVAKANPTGALELHLPSAAALDGAQNCTCLSPGMGAHLGKAWVTVGQAALVSWGDAFTVSLAVPKSLACQVWP